jgi:hypothetical protein
MKSIHLLFSTVLLTLAAMWVRAATQGVEPALISAGVEFCVQGLRAGTKAFSNINFHCRLESPTRLLNTNSSRNTGSYDFQE